MPVMMIMEWSGVTPAQYDQLRETVNFEGDPPPGGMYHVAAFDEKGLRVTDVWQSEEHFQAFADARLMPVVQQLGIQGQPKVEIYPAHRIFTPAYTPK
jgi:hypothetical protein